MYIPERTKAEYSKVIDELIEEGRKVHQSFRKEVQWRKSSFGSVGRTAQPQEVTIFDREAFAAWKTRCIALTDTLLSAGTGLSNYLQFGAVETNGASVEYAIGQLQGLQQTLTSELLTDLGLKVEAAIASDYMGQAEALLGEGLEGRYDHIPAAVLSGAVLEKALKTLCTRQSPSISLANENGKPKMLNSLIDDLKKAGVYNETKAKQLRAWAGIRNDAAHGEFEAFKKTDVEAMVKGIGDFLGDYLR